jgi:hypothetical protein
VFFAIVFGHDGGSTGEGVFEAVEFGERHAFLFSFPSLDLDFGMAVGWNLRGGFAGC